MVYRDQLVEDGGGILTRAPIGVDRRCEGIYRLGRIQPRQTDEDHRVARALQGLVHAQTLPRELLRRLRDLVKGLASLARHIEQPLAKGVDLTV